MSANAADRGLRATQLRLVALAVLVAITAQFFRNAHVVVAPELMRELNASAASLAALTSALFITSACLQIPGGILLDRFGTRVTLPIMLLICGIGAGLFGSAQSVAGLVVARIVMGIGGAVLVMSGIILCVRWFDVRHFSSLAGGIMASSQLGNLFSTAPMALMATWFGWRGAYFVMVIATIALAVIVYLAARDAPPGHDFHARPRETLAESAAGVREVLRIPGIWRLMVMGWMAWGTMACIVGLWAGPYLSDVHGLATIPRGNALFWMVAGGMAGALSFTYFDRTQGGTKRSIKLGAGINVVLLVVLAALPEPGLVTATVLLALVGLVGGYSVLITAHGRQFYTDRLMARGMTTINCAVLFGAASLQAGSGVLVSALSTPGMPIAAQTYRIMFATLAIALSAALACYWRCPERAIGDRPR